LVNTAGLIEIVEIDYPGRGAPFQRFLPRLLQRSPATAEGLMH